ncbi:MAG TPA: hypothetical protein VM580_27045, partial [Labilithrix sp.]|nr:hypothetical protein [Labilithrix sp.]
HRTPAGLRLTLAGFAVAAACAGKRQTSSARRASMPAPDSTAAAAPDSTAAPEPALAPVPQSTTVLARRRRAA